MSLLQMIALIFLIPPLTYLCVRFGVYAYWTTTKRWFKENANEKVDNYKDVKMQNGVNHVKKA